MYDVTALGELLIDFTDAGMSPSGQKLFERNPGGAPANVLVALQRLGHSTAFVGKVGCDMHGVFLRQTLEENDVDCSGLVSDPDHFTTLAFVALDPTGERTFSFARKPGADTQLRPEELNRDVLQNTRVLHVGSLSLTDEPARSATLEALHIARDAGATLSYDPNYRASLWPAAEVAAQQMRSVVGMMDLVKISAEETGLLTDESDPPAAHHDVRALRRELPRDADPDAAGRARYHRDLALESVHVASPCGNVPAARGAARRPLLMARYPRQKVIYV